MVIAHYAPRRLAGAGRLPDRPAGRRTLASSTASGASASSARGSSRCTPGSSEHLGFLPFFAGPASSTGRTILTASHRAGDHGAADHHRDLAARSSPRPRSCTSEAALALGATRWEMMRLAVFPYARSGMVSAVMLGLGRALGETMAVAMVLSADGDRDLLNLISSDQPRDDRLQHRAELPGGDRCQGQRAHRQRPGAVRDHLRRSTSRLARWSPVARGRPSDDHAHADSDARPARPARACSWPPRRCPAGRRCWSLAVAAAGSTLVSLLLGWAVVGGVVRRRLALHRRAARVVAPGRGRAGAPRTG